MQEEDLALTIFKKLHNPDNSTLKVTKGNRVKLTSEQLASARNNSILLNLFMHTAFTRYYTTGDIDFTYNKLKECEQYFNKHSDSYTHYIGLARLSYEKGLVKDAVRYTEKAEQGYGLKKEVILNKIFFAILEIDVSAFVSYIRKLNSSFLNKTQINFVDIIGFLENEKEKYPKSQKLFDFAIGYYYLFVDIEEGRRIISNYTNINSNYKPLSSLSVELMSKKGKHTIPENKSIKTKKRRKKRR